MAIMVSWLLRQLCDFWQPNSLVSVQQAAGELQMLLIIATCNSDQSWKCKVVLHRHTSLSVSIHAEAMVRLCRLGLLGQNFSSSFLLFFHQPL